VSSLGIGDIVDAGEEGRKKSVTDNASVPTGRIELARAPSGTQDGELDFIFVSLPLPLCLSSMRARSALIETPINP